MPYMKLCNEGTGVLLLRSCILIILLPHSEQRVVSAHLTQFMVYVQSLKLYLLYSINCSSPFFVFSSLFCILIVFV